MCSIVESVHRLLLNSVKATRHLHIYRRNVLLARMATAFRLVEVTGNDILDGKPSSRRIRELIQYMDDQRKNAACFDDVKEYLDCLDAGGLKYIAYEHAYPAADDTEGPVLSARDSLLSLQLKYFVATSPLSRASVPGKERRISCLVCGAKHSSPSCSSCFENIAKMALRSYNTHTETLKDNPSALSELLPGFAMAVALSHIQLAFVHQTANMLGQPCQSRHLLRALLTLEHLQRLTPKHSQLSLVLLQLHMLFGSAHRAYELWRVLDVKKSIVDALAPIFYDRVSAISPILLHSLKDLRHEQFETLGSHYDISLYTRMPRQIIDAFEAGNYSSALDIPPYMESLRSSCTRAMSLVEESRADRLLGEPGGEVLHDARFCMFIASKALTTLTVSRRNQ